VYLKLIPNDVLNSGCPQNVKSLNHVYLKTGYLSNYYGENVRKDKIRFVVAFINP